MRTLIAMTLLISLISYNCFGQTESNVVLLEKNSPAPFKGYLFTEEKTLKIRQDLIDINNLKILKSSYEKSIDLYEKKEDNYNNKINLLLEQNDKLSKALQTQQQYSELNKTLWFVMGVLATGVGAYAVSNSR